MVGGSWVGGRRDHVPRMRFPLGHADGAGAWANRSTCCQASTELGHVTTWGSWAKRSTSLRRSPATGHATTCGSWAKRSTPASDAGAGLDGSSATSAATVIAPAAAGPTAAATAPDERGAGPLVVTGPP